MSSKTSVIFAIGAAFMATTALAQGHNSISSRDVRLGDTACTHYKDPANGSTNVICGPFGKNGHSDTAGEQARICTGSLFPDGSVKVSCVAHDKTGTEPAHAAKKSHGLQPRHDIESNCPATVTVIPDWCLPVHTDGVPTPVATVATSEPVHSIEVSSVTTVPTSASTKVVLHSTSTEVTLPSTTAVPISASDRITNYIVSRGTTSTSVLPSAATTVVSSNGVVKSFGTITVAGLVVCAVVNALFITMA